VLRIGFDVGIGWMPLLATRISGRCSTSTSATDALELHSPLHLRDRRGSVSVLIPSFAAHEIGPMVAFDLRVG